jgi:hypothetical protein
MDHCPLCLKEASSSQAVQLGTAVQCVDCPACGSLVFTAGAVAFLNAHSEDDPRRREYSVALQLVQRASDHPIDDTTLKLWSDWLQVSGPEKLERLVASRPDLRDA